MRTLPYLYSHNHFAGPSFSSCPNCGGGCQPLVGCWCDEGEMGRLVQASPLTVTPVTVLQWHFSEPPIGPSYNKNVWIQWHSKKLPSYSDTFLPSQHWHCKWGGLYNKCQLMLCHIPHNVRACKHWLTMNVFQEKGHINLEFVFCASVTHIHFRMKGWKEEGVLLVGVGSMEPHTPSLQHPSKSLGSVEQFSWRFVLGCVEMSGQLVWISNGELKRCFKLLGLGPPCCPFQSRMWTLGKRRKFLHTPSSLWW